MTVTRKLAAILASDVAGYSSLMGADEEGTLERLKAHRRELIDPKVAEYHGRIVKTTGDGMLVEFGSVVDAVRCAVAVQQSTGTRNRLMLDIAGWRSNRRSELTELGRRAADEVKESGESQKLRPMTPFERKIVHDAVASVDGVHSESEGEEPRRRVVVLPGR